MRKAVSFSERDGPSATFGRDLLNYIGILFEYWHDYKAGKLDQATFRAWMAPVRAQVEALLVRAAASSIDRLSGSCADILAHKALLWTFVDNDGVEPTNNHAERELRAFVLWRKRSFGTQSDRGNLFAERLMSVVHTARKQGRDVLGFLTGLRSARWRYPRTLAVRRRCLTAAPSRCGRRRGRHREIASALPLPDRTHSPGTLEARHRHLQRARRSPDLRRQRRHRLARTSAQRRIEPLSQRHHFLERASRCRLRPRSRLRPRIRTRRP